MDRLIGIIVTAIAAFSSTNIDDFVILLSLILGMPLEKIRWRQIVAGQYLGFCVLLTISALAGLILRAFSESWVGVLAIIPIALGVRGFAQAVRSSDEQASATATSAFMVAIVTVANGGDNVSVYSLLFRHLNLTGATLTILIFLILLGFLCALALVVGRRPGLVPKIVRGSSWLTPAVFVSIGVFLLIRTGAVSLIVRSI